MGSLSLSRYQDRRGLGCRAGCPAADGCRRIAGGVAGQGSGCLVASGKRSVTAGVVDGIGLPLTRRGPRWHTSPTFPADETLATFPISACCWLVCMLDIAVLMASRRCLAWSVGPGITGANSALQPRTASMSHTPILRRRCQDMTSLTVSVGVPGGPDVGGVESESDGESVG
jgi:hypothetical protein